MITQGVEPQVFNARCGIVSFERRKEDCVAFPVTLQEL